MKDRKGTTVKLHDWAEHFQFDGFGGSEVRIEDTWENVTGGSWMNATGNPAALVYAMRSGTSKGRIPLNDDVWYGKLGSLGVLVHEVEINDGEGEGQVSSVAEVVE